MNKRKTIISIILTFLILLAGMGIYQWLSKQENTNSNVIVEKEPLRTLKIRQLQSSTVNHKINIDGRLTAYKKINLSTNVSGILLPSSTPVKKGLHIKKGTLLFEIDQEKAVYNLYALRSKLLNAITLIMPDLKIDYPEAHTNWKKYLDDFEVEKPVQALPKITNEQEKYFVVSRNIQSLYYNIKNAEAQLDDYKIHAPFSGVITRADVYPGTMVMPGQPLAEMINSSHFELEAPVTEKDLASIEIGNRVQLSSEVSDKSWIGKVARISNQIDRTTQSIPVYISVKGNELKEGMYLKGQINGSPLNDIVSIPKEFVVNQEYVFIAKDSFLHLLKLDIKNRDEEMVFANEPGYEVWIVDQDPRGLFEGQKIAPIKR